MAWYWPRGPGTQRYTQEYPSDPLSPTPTRVQTLVFSPRSLLSSFGAESKSFYNEVARHEFPKKKACLVNYGVRGSSLDWFRNYLTTRTQRVQFKNDMSSTRAICFGVPQGSILGPLLFVLYINNLTQCLENCSINMYADDTVMYFTNLGTWRQLGQYRMI